MRMPMRRRALAVLVCAGALMVGCGGQQQSQTPAATVFVSTPAPAAPTPLPTADERGIEQPAAEASAPTPVSELQVELRPIVEGLVAPVHVTNAGDGSGRLFVVGKRGTITVVREGDADTGLFLDITNRVGSRGSEQGLLSVAFHPRYTENELLYVNYTDRNGDTVVSRFQADGDQADASSEQVLLRIAQPYANHNGGLVKFGPDGYLYIGMGDGGSGGDPLGNGQDLQALLGKMLRIDVDAGEPYAIPSDNPWADGQGGRPEIYSLGLRNPWRFSFDRATGDLYIGDVGQNAYEEINMQPAGTGAGVNYGWNTSEGRHCFGGAGCALEQDTLPVAEYDHGVGCSVTGGYVYRGQAFPSMDGTYIYGDYCSGLMWALRQTEPGRWEQAEILESNLQISSFGEDEAGELYLTALGDGGLYQVVAQ